MTNPDSKEKLAEYASDVVVGAMERGLPIGALAAEISRREFPRTSCPVVTLTDTEREAITYVRRWVNDLVNIGWTQRTDALTALDKLLGQEWAEI